MSRLAARTTAANAVTARRGLRIGVVAPPWYTVPPQGYGGTEAVVASLVDQLVIRGHEVTLLAAGSPGTLAQHYIRSYERPPSHLLGSDSMPELVQAAEAGRALDELPLDLIHDHSVAGPLLARGRKCPTVVTMHGPVSGHNGDYFGRLGSTVNIVAISNAQRVQAPALNWVGTVHNAIDVASFPYREDKSDAVLWIGRFSADKGAHIAIEVARKAGRRIVLAGKLSEPAEKAYFESAVRPLLGRDTEFVGEADAKLKRELFAMAACLLSPIQWEEPFGMVMVEALACGTPVVSTRLGSAPEIVRHGQTGFIADGVDELCAAIRRVDRIDPAACRRDAEERFDLPIMAAGYERVYRMLTEHGEGIRSLTSGHVA